MIMYRRHPDAVSTELGGEVVALQLGTKRYYTLNATAARAWQELEQCVSAEALEHALARDFDIEVPEVQPHVDQLVRQLLQSKLIERCTSGDTSSS
jgi:hypothetical protein